MAESKICGTVVDGHPVQVKVIVDFQRIADKLAAKARKQKNGKASDCHGCVRVEVVPIAKPAGSLAQAKAAKIAALNHAPSFDNCVRSYCKVEGRCLRPDNCGRFAP